MHSKSKAEQAHYKCIHIMKCCAKFCIPDYNVANCSHNMLITTSYASLGYLIVTGGWLEVTVFVLQHEDYRVMPSSVLGLSSPS